MPKNATLHTTHLQVLASSQLLWQLTELAAHRLELAGPTARRPRPQCYTPASVVLACPNHARSSEMRVAWKLSLAIATLAQDKPSRTPATATRSVWRG